ncbi:hypothetical protein IEQ34_012542 [Dendrobium chrysotoxum]|uniref:Uncharacterized protein n=1 Tax=Dendrobium chrysotoxum TaxID=161865 RepID=A0AAV7GVJ2_DENCH|nr:hypothetical protein IEQ34_012542 [Dendrobium chrysotoxum]
MERFQKICWRPSAEAISKKRHNAKPPNAMQAENPEFFYFLLKQAENPNSFCFLLKQAENPNSFCFLLKWAGNPDLMMIIIPLEPPRNQG